MLWFCNRIRPEDYLCQFSDSYLEACGRNLRKTQPAKFAVPPCMYIFDKSRCVDEPDTAQVISFKEIFLWPALPKTVADRSLKSVPYHYAYISRSSLEGTKY